MLKVSVMMVVFLTVRLKAMPRRIVCQDPDLIQSREKPYSDLEYESRSILLNHTRNTRSYRGISCRYKNITREPLPWSYTTCNKTDVQDNERSVCPWHYVRNYDPNRIPQVMYEARCSNSSCIDISVKANEKRRPKCKEIYHYVTVLRRKTCSSKVYVYEEFLEPLASGCGCFLASRTCPSGPIVPLGVGDISRTHP